MIELIIAEDEELARQELENTMPWEKWGYKLIGSAEDGIAAWELIKKHKPGLVLSDIRMPGMDGLQLLRKTSSILAPAHRPLFVFISGHADFEYAQEAIKLGAFDYLIKPVDDLELEETMARAAQGFLSNNKTKNYKSAELINAKKDISLPVSYSDKRIEAAIKDMQERLVMDLGVESVATKLGISGDHLSRLIKKASGLTFNEYLTQLRMIRAKELLADRTVLIGEVADLCGYRDARYFSTVFRRYVGMTPSEYRLKGGRGI